MLFRGLAKLDTNQIITELACNLHIKLDYEIRYFMNTRFHQKYPINAYVTKI